MTFLNQPVLDTILAHLAGLFLSAADGDAEKAREAAAQTLSAYNFQNEEELCLASEIISFSLHALDALAQAADPELSSNRTIRLRGSAVSLSREAHKARRKLDQLQRARHAGAAQLQPAVSHPDPSVPQPERNADPEVNADMARAFAEAERVAKQIIARDGGMTWSQSYQKRQLVKRMGENLKKNQAKHAALLSEASPGPEAAQASV